MIGAVTFLSGAKPDVLAISIANFAIERARRMADELQVAVLAAAAHKK